jgi:hypothetical protein
LLRWRGGITASIRAYSLSDNETNTFIAAPPKIRYNIYDIYFYIQSNFHYLKKSWRGQGRTKKQAEQLAARQALETLPELAVEEDRGGE